MYDPRCQPAARITTRAANGGYGAASGLMPSTDQR
jgi:hypothetical protein